MTGRSGNTTITMPGNGRRPPPPTDESHDKGDKTFARLFANDIAYRDISAKSFGVGSILVREKLAAVDSTAPAAVTVMIKREKGFDPSAGDWEFAMMKSEPNMPANFYHDESCIKCHRGVKDYDFVFRSIFP